jgi:hypothetical protein
MNQLRIIWAAIVMSTVVYFVILWTAMRDRPFTRPLEQSLRDPRTIEAYAIAVVLYFMAFIVSGGVERRGGRGMENMRRAAIMRFAILEGVCVIGLVVAFLESDWRLYLPTFVLAFIGFARSLPRERYEL